MKKVIAIILLLVTLSFLLTGCGVYKVNSLDAYQKQVTNSGIGFSSIGIDDPKYVLPSYTFLDDYAYLEGDYYLHENDILNFLVDDTYMPNRSFITLKYDKSIYLKAKQCVLDNIPAFEDQCYIYGDYQFYVNKKFMDHKDKDSSFPYLLYMCTMVCYNDNSCTICFLGFDEAEYTLPEKYINDLENNWTSFIDEFYGEYYDFSK